MQEPEGLCPPFITRSSALQAYQARQLVNAIREIEFGGFFGNGFCPACGGMKAHGHSPGCPVGLALLPDHGVAALKHEVRIGLNRVVSHRHSLESLVGVAVRELDDLDATLRYIQDFLERL